MPRGLPTLLSLHYRFKLCLQAFQALLLGSHGIPHTRIQLARSELLTHLFEIHLCGELERQRHVPLLESDLFFGVFDLHDGSGK